MKKLLLLALCLGGLFASELRAQFVPQAFNYQTVLRGSDGHALTNQTVSLRFEIKSGAPNGPVAYAEKQVLTSNELGLINAAIGQGGQVLSGDFAAINWGGGSKFLTIGVESSPGNFDELGTQQLMSVPYAQYAFSAANTSGGTGDNWGNQSATVDNSLNGNGTNASPLGIAQQGAAPGQVLKWDGTKWAPSDDVSNTATNGGTVTQINSGLGLSGGPVTVAGTISLANSGVQPGVYGSATQIPVIQVDATGRVTNVFTSVVSPGTIGMTGGTGINVQQNGSNFTVTNTGDTNPFDDITNGSTAGGDISGTFANLQINQNAVASGEILDQGIFGADINKMNAQSGQVLKWDGNTWAPANDAGGTSVSLSAGAGITIGGSAPNYIIGNTGDTNPSDDLTNSSQAGGDVQGTFSNLQLINGAVEASNLDDMGAAFGQVLKWNGMTWQPAADNSGANTLNAGAGISITGASPNFTITNTGDTNPGDDLTQFSTAGGDVQGSFSNLQIVGSAVGTGEIADFSIQNSDLAGQSITGDKINQMSASFGQVLKWNGATWAPGADNTSGAGGGDNWGTQVVETQPVLSGNGTSANPLTLAPQGASAGQVLKWNGTSWLPGNDLTGGTGGNNFSAGTGISFAGVAPNLTINNGGDLSTTNEIQTLSINGNQISLSLGGGTVMLPGGTGGTYTAGPGIGISGNTISNTGDLSTTNELQSLNLSGATLSISSGNSVNLSSLAGGGFWTLNSANIANNNAGSVLVGPGNATLGKMQVRTNITSEPAAQIRVENSGSFQPALIAETIGGGPALRLTSATGQALVTTKGNVGINVNNPASPLTVQADSVGIRLQGTTPEIVFNNNNGPGVGGGLDGFIQQQGGSFVVGTRLGNPISLTPAKVPALTATAKGFVCINGTDPQKYSLRVICGDYGMSLHHKPSGHNWELATQANGTLQLFNDAMGLVPAGTFAANGLYTPSDRRLKKDIVDLPSVLDKLLKINPVSYRYTVENESAPASLGFVAQDVQAQFPELVTENSLRGEGDKFLAVNYAGFGVLAVKAIQEQQAEMKKLQEENLALKARLERLEKRLEKF